MALVGAEGSVELAVGWKLVEGEYLKVLPCVLVGGVVV